MEWEARAEIEMEVVKELSQNSKKIEDFSK